MNNRYIRDLPFPPTSFFTPEIVRQIKAIPLEDIPYTEDEIAWMERAIVDMERNLEVMIRHAIMTGREAESITVRKKQYEIAIAQHKKSRTDSSI